MPKFLAVYTMNPENLARFRRLTEAEQDAIDADGIPKWLAWETRNAGAIVHRGGMVGKTTRVTAGGIAPATNAWCKSPEPPPTPCIDRSIWRRDMAAKNLPASCLTRIPRVLFTSPKPS